MKLRRQHSERGQTIILVAISIVALLAMAALAIDVVSLYVARSEVQRAADAAALVGAKAIADSGVTSVPPGDPSAAAAKALAQSMADSAITSLLSASPGLNQVAGGQPVMMVGTPTIVYNDPGGNNLTNNPIITVQLQRANLPIFFARIFGQGATNTSATASAEAYNPANMQNFTPVAPRCVKPWLVANLDPSKPGSTPFVDTSTGAVESGAIGARFYLLANCNSGTSSSCHLVRSPFGENPPTVDFVPASITASTTDVFPACAGSSDYERSIAGCNVSLYDFYQCGSTDSTHKTSWDTTINPTPNHNGSTSATALATECLIHATGTGLGQGQDILDPPLFPGGSPRITAQSGPMAGSLVSTSNSSVTIPLIVPADVHTSPPFEVTVAGFMQAFIESVVNLGPNAQDAVQITVLNVVGCSSTPNAANPITGGNGASAVAVRLITTPSP